MFHHILEYVAETLQPIAGAQKAQQLWQVQHLRKIQSGAEAGAHQ
jgi:hypothetical protein